jgi:hypothetical protein
MLYMPGVTPEVVHTGEDTGGNVDIASGVFSHTVSAAPRVSTAGPLLFLPGLRGKVNPRLQSPWRSAQVNEYRYIGWCMMSS